MKASLSILILGALTLASCGVEQIAPQPVQHEVIAPVDQGAPKGNSACLNAYLDSVVAIDNCAILKLYHPDSVACIVAYQDSGYTDAYREAVTAWDARWKDLECDVFSSCIQDDMDAVNAHWYPWGARRGFAQHRAGLREEELHLL